ncbi:MAG: hypothetical protein AAGA43_01150 [Bacteroidota bacterium]
MKQLLALLSLILPFMAIDCEDDCVVEENWEEENVTMLMELSQLEDTYSQGDILTLTAQVPSENTFFDRTVDLNLESGDNTALLMLLSDNIFIENNLDFKKGQQGQFANWFLLPFNPTTGMYELEVDVELQRIGAYSHFNSGTFEFGSSDCPDFILNSRFAGVEDQFIEFTVDQ